MAYPGQSAATAETVMYTQLQPWSSMGALPCMEQVSGSPVPAKVGEYFRTPRPHPWRPTLGYETIQVQPLLSQTITNQLSDPCYTPEGMATEPLKFPNLVTGFERNPGHAARVALYTRYTPFEWSQNQTRFYNEVNTNIHYADKLRQDTVRLMRAADETIKNGQAETGRMIGERLTEIEFWERELTAEMERLILECQKMQDCRRALQRAIMDLEAPLQVAQECLYQREFRKGAELVHDETEQCLLREVETIRRAIKKLQLFVDKCAQILNEARAAQNELEVDLSNKEISHGIDTLSHQLNNFSKGIEYFGGIEKYDVCVTEGETWSQASNDLIVKSQKIRKRSADLRTNTETGIDSVPKEIWDAWTRTNNALGKRAAELLEAKSKIIVHLQQVQKDIFSVEKTMELIRKSIADKSSTLKVAHTRLEARTHRPQSELCRDYAQTRMVTEVDTIKTIIHELHMKLQECEAQHQQLLKTRNNLETELKSKVDSLFVDREKCMGMRRTYPIAATIKY
ncbi:tektin-3-like [Venturia canescens]|uniref:tektin-3-like n=1 Tax=Venturia canescens TaxID=32260 RepID=UPI001C9BF602|nr:tektin-3-like [Venturia canescens]